MGIIVASRRKDAKILAGSKIINFKELDKNNILYFKKYIKNDNGEKNDSK